MGSSGGGQSSQSDTVTLTLPRKVAQDLLVALTTALGNGGPKPKSEKKVGGSK